MRRYSNASLAEWISCGRSKLTFCKAAFRAAKNSDRVICGHIAQLPVVWAASLFRPNLSYYLVAHGIEVWRPFSFLERRAIKGAKLVLCVSEYTRQQVLDHCPMPAARAVVLFNALDPYMDPPSPSPAPKNPPIVLTVSRLSIADSYKGIEHLIASMPAVLAEIPGARLRIVGRGDGLPGLQRLVKRLGLGEAVEFVGYRSDAELHEDFAQSSLFALPSEKEGFGLVYVEAMAHGRPCLAANSGGAPEVVDSDTGVLVRYGDVPGIAAAIVGAARREWSIEALLNKARSFSYLRFKERLASLISE